MSDSIKVRKRNGRGIEPLNLEKMHKMVEEATTGLAGVSASQVEINSGIQKYMERKGYATIGEMIGKAKRQ